MLLRYKKLSDKAFEPIKTRIEDAGIDFRLSREVKWDRKGGLYVGVAHTDVAIEIPRGYFMMTAPRSSMLFKYNIAVFPSVIDTGYTGEITFLLHYLGDGEPPKIDIGSKVAQIVMVPTALVSTEMEEVDVLPAHSDRADKGFGSTGV